MSLDKYSGAIKTFIASESIVSNFLKTFIQA